MNNPEILSSIIPDRNLPRSEQELNTHLDRLLLAHDIRGFAAFCGPGGEDLSAESYRSMWDAAILLGANKVAPITGGRMDRSKRTCGLGIQELPHLAARTLRDIYGLDVPSACVTPTDADAKPNSSLVTDPYVAKDHKGPDRNLLLIKAADMIAVADPYSSKSAGTCIELFTALQLGKPTVVFGQDEDKHILAPWVEKYPHLRAFGPGCDLEEVYDFFKGNNPSLLPLYHEAVNLV